MTESILFERLLGKTVSTSVLSHLIEHAGFEYTVTDLVDILELDLMETLDVIEDLLDQKIIQSTDEQNPKFSFVDDSNPKTAALAAYANAVIFENLDALKSEVLKQ